MGKEHLVSGTARGATALEQDGNLIRGTIDEAIAHTKQNLAEDGSVLSRPF